MVLPVFLWWQLHVVTIATSKHLIVLIRNFHRNALEADLTQRKYFFLGYSPLQRVPVCEICEKHAIFLIGKSSRILPFCMDPCW